MAQLVAHLLCKQGVTGSSPVSSTFYPQPDGCGFLFVSFINPYGAKVLMRLDCAVENDLSDHLVIRGITTRPLSTELQSGLLAVVMTAVFPQPCAQLCINRVDGCLPR